MKQIQLRIYPDGRVQADVQGIQGKACTNYIKILEDLLASEAVSSSYTPEYYQEQLLETDLTHRVDNRQA